MNPFLSKRVRIVLAIGYIIALKCLVWANQLLGTMYNEVAVAMTREMLNMDQFRLNLMMLFFQPSRLSWKKRTSLCGTLELFRDLRFGLIRSHSRTISQPGVLFNRWTPPRHNFCRACYIIVTNGADRLISPGEACSASIGRTRNDKRRIYIKITLAVARAISIVCIRSTHLHTGAALCSLSRFSFSVSSDLNFQS